MCNCIKELHEELTSEKDVTYAKIGLSTIQSIVNGKLTGPYKTGQQVTIEKSVLNRKGEKKIKRTNTFVSHDFCPFCGLKY